MSQRLSEIFTPHLSKYQTMAYKMHYDIHKQLNDGILFILIMKYRTYIYNNMHEMVHCVNLKISINNMVIGPGYNANIYQVCLNIIKPNDYGCDVLKVVKIFTTLVKVILRILNIDNCGKDDLIDIGGQIKQLFTYYCDQLKFLFVESRKNLKYVYCEDNNDRNKEWDENNYKYVGVKTDDTKYNKQ